MSHLLRHRNILRIGMTPPLQSKAGQRPPRQKLVNPAPVVLRVPNGSRVRGKLQVISVTGGLLSLSELLQQGCVARVMFMTDVGSVQGTAEMLIPISATLQPFRFVAIDPDDQSRIKNSIHSGTEQNRRDRQSLVHHRAS
jgi:hypothetical protein